MMLIVVAMLAEGITESIKRIVVDKKIQWPYVIALVVGQLLAFATQFDILHIVDINQNPSVLGIVLTGILISRGSNYVSDLMSRLNKGLNG